MMAQNINVSTEGLVCTEGVIWKGDSRWLLLEIRPKVFKDQNNKCFIQRVIHLFTLWQNDPIY